LVIKDVTIRAELQTPAGPEAVKLDVNIKTSQEDDEARRNEEASEGLRVLARGATVQGIVRHDLKDEGQHVLAVTVMYTEVSRPVNGSEDDAQDRTRTFRKLYQFVAQQAVGIRTKVGEILHKSPAADGKQRKKFALEAQLENLTDQSVLLEDVSLTIGQGVRSRSLNGQRRPLLAPQDVEQVAFVLNQIDGEELEESGGRFVLAQLTVRWRVMMEEGMLKTGWLGSRKR